MKKIHFASLVFLATGGFLLSCNNKSEKKADDKKADTTIAVNPAGKGIKLVCKDMGADSMEIPHYDVYLWVDGAETKIKSVNGCSDITKESYEQYQIPKEAIAACGGWYAGGGEYYYVILRNGKPVVFEGWQDEGQDDEGFHWEEITVK